MNFAKSLLLTGLLLLSPAIKAQTPPTHLIASPGMTIGGHKFDKTTRIGGAVMNRRGDVAFVASWKRHGESHTAIFTADRIVAQEGDVFGLDTIARISLHPDLRISEYGVVSYTANVGTPSHSGRPKLYPLWIFVENRRVGIPRRDAAGEPVNYQLDYGGHIVFLGEAGGPVVVPPPLEKLHHRFSRYLKRPHCNRRPHIDDVGCTHYIERPDILLNGRLSTALERYGFGLMADNLPTGFIVLLIGK